MSREVPRWMLLVAVLGCLVGMLLWARGPTHHHGRYVGALHSLVVVQGSAG
jgi:hypothetical protein